MKTNVKRASIHTYEGAKAKYIKPYAQLRRSLLSCFLWEKEFYEDGKTIADRIEEYADKCSAEEVAQLAIEARTEHNLRHAPLMLLLALIKKGGKSVSEAIYQTISRADEVTELVALYWRNGKRPLSKQMKLGLGRALGKFNEYQLAKYNRDTAIKLRDVMFLTHAKPQNKEQEALFKKLANNELSTPDTWEARMGAGQDKCAVFTDLLKRNKLGYLALLRNLRGMNEAGVEHSLITNALENNNASKVLPFRFIAAAKHAPMLERSLDTAMIKSLENQEKLLGSTVLLVDVSYSMHDSLSSKSDMNRLDAACGLSILLSGICNDLRVFTFSNSLVEVPPRTGMALRDAVVNSQTHGSTYLGSAVREIDSKLAYDRLIVITDEQSHDRVPDPKGRGYMLNVASARNGVGYGAWVHIDGFSEACINFVRQYEKEVNR